MGNNKKKLKKKISKKTRRVLVELCCFLLFIVGTYSMIVYGCLIGEISTLAFERFPLIGYLSGVLGFFGVNIYPYIRLLSRLDYIERLCDKCNVTLEQVLRHKTLVDMFDKGQLTPLIMIGLSSVFYPYWLMLLSGWFYTRFTSMWMFVEMIFFTMLLIIFTLIYLRRMLSLIRVSKSCQIFIEYAKSHK